MDAIPTDSLYDSIRLISWVLVTAASGDYASTAAFSFYVLITTRMDVMPLTLHGVVPLAWEWEAAGEGSSSAWQAV